MDKDKSIHIGWFELFYKRCMDSDKVILLYAGSMINVPWLITRS